MHIGSMRGMLAAKHAFEWYVEPDRFNDGPPRKCIFVDERVKFRKIECQNSSVFTLGRGGSAKETAPPRVPSVSPSPFFAPGKRIAKETAR